MYSYETLARHHKLLHCRIRTKTYGQSLLFRQRPATTGTLAAKNIHTHNNYTQTSTSNIHNAATARTARTTTAAPSYIHDYDYISLTNTALTEAF